MVQKVQIENFKSISSLTLELGRVNVFIGENGCGKTNILEAIALGSAAAEDMLENNFLAEKGIRITEPSRMRSGFEQDSAIKNVKISLFGMEQTKLECDLSHPNKPYSQWRNESKIYVGVHELADVLEQASKKMSLSEFSKLPILLMGKGIRWLLNKEEASDIAKVLLETLQYKINTDTYSNFLDFCIFSPENYFLRRFEDESKDSPLGIRGEGLFKLLNILKIEEEEGLHKHFSEINENLSIIDWFEELEIPTDLVFTEKKIRIKDRFLDEKLAYFDQRSANEGFLYLLFYFALFISNYTPRFFAIDNIDTAFNPKLCAKVIQILVELAKKQEKQVIMTTHNPAILDGLDLTDEEQRLFVVSRNKLGHTLVKRIEKKEPLENQKPVKLSEQFLRGYIGGLPKNF